MVGGREFQPGKFKDLVLYFALASSGDEGFGMVKLNKLLFRADFEAYRRLGQSITGERYDKQDFGPVAWHLPVVLDDLAGAGFLIWQHFASGPYTRHVPEAKVVPSMRGFSAPELKIVQDALSELAEHGGKSVSEWSHEASTGWQVQEIGDEIPYVSALVSLAPLSDRARTEVRDELQRRYG